VTESVTLSDRDRGVTVPRYKRVFSGNTSQFCSVPHVCRCLPHRRPVLEDGSGSVSAQECSRKRRYLGSPLILLIRQIADVSDCRLPTNSHGLD